VSDDNNKVVSLSEARAQREKRGQDYDDIENAHLMLSISIFKVPGIEAPIDITISATDADSNYNLSALFVGESETTPRLLAFALGLVRLADLVVALHLTQNKEKSGD
jgi:hypothetical protein